jgi:serine/threonine-protein kinase
MKSDLLNMMGRSYQGLGLFDVAAATLESALVTSRRTGSDVRIARDLMWLGNLASDREDFAAAESLSRSALASQRRSVPAGSPELMAQLIFLAEVLRKTGRLDEAESLVQEALAIARRQRPEVPLRVALMLNDLGHVLRDRGDFAGAATRYREALELRRAVLGPDHADVANLEINLARVRHRLGDTTAATAMRNAIAVKRRAFGDRHPEVAWDRAELAEVLEGQGELVEAESLYLAALEVQRRALRPGHTRTAVTLLGLGRVALARGDSASARDRIAESLTMLRGADWPEQRRIQEGERILASLGPP